VELSTLIAAQESAEGIVGLLAGRVSEALQSPKAEQTDRPTRKQGDWRPERLKWSVGPLYSGNKAGGNVVARKSDIHGRQRIPKPRSAALPK
jgi:hypothetical protein